MKRMTGRFAAFGLLLGCLGIASTASSSPPLAPTKLRVCDAASPAGVGASPYFGWYVNDPDPNEIQTAYQIQVSANASFSGEFLWDSGKTTARSQNHVRYNGSALSADSRVTWRVKTWDKDGNEGAWSEPASFTVGLLENGDWAGANWIRRDSSDADDYTYYRKTAELPAGEIERATVYISGVHKYALYVNGTLAGKGPAYHHPEYQYYNAFDVTGLITPGAANLFAVFNHWFGGGQGRPESARGIIMKAVFHYADGASSVVGTDGTWKQSQAAAWVSDQPHRNKGEGVGYVEKIDSRLLIPDWNAVGFDDSSWGVAAVIGPQPVAPWTGTLSSDLTRIAEHEILAVDIKRNRDGSFLVDFGKVYAGVPRIRFPKGASGETVEMLGGYALDDSGHIDPAQNQQTDMSYVAVLGDEPFFYEPVEYLGLRYLEIKNAPKRVASKDVSFIVRHSGMDAAASSFESPDDTLNAVWNLMKHSLTTCAQEEFVDTPTREKGGFLGDSIIQSTVAMPVMNERLLTQRTLNEFLQSMDSRDFSGTGRMNAVYPNRDGARDIPDFTQAYLPWVWAYYMETGDLEFLSANYVKLELIVGYVYRHEDSGNGLVCNLTGGKGPYRYGIVDWPEPMRFGYDISTTARTVINGWALTDYKALSEIAGALGKKADQSTWDKRVEALEAAINSKLVNSAGLYVDGLRSDGTQSTHVSQHANMFPLALGIVPEENRERVVDEVREQGIRTGMVMMPWLIRAAGEAGEGGYLIELFTNEKWPGWAQCLEKGATCTWESWDSDTAENESMSHAWGAAGLEGYVRYILGIRPMAPQYEKVLIKPLDFGSKLDWARGSITTDRGRISVDWVRKSSSCYKLNVILPVNVTADIMLPRGGGSEINVIVDGSAAEVVEDGDYLVVRNIGSGAHSLVRSSTTDAAKN